MSAEKVRKAISDEVFIETWETHCHKGKAAVAEALGVSLGAVTQRYKSLTKANVELSKAATIRASKSRDVAALNALANKVRQSKGKASTQTPQKSRIVASEVSKGSSPGLRSSKTNLDDFEDEE